MKWSTECQFPGCDHILWLCKYHHGRKCTQELSVRFLQCLVGLKLFQKLTLN